MQFHGFYVRSNHVRYFRQLYRPKSSQPPCYAHRPEPDETILHWSSMHIPMHSFGIARPKRKTDQTYLCTAKRMLRKMFSVLCIEAPGCKVVGWIVATYSPAAKINSFFFISLRRITRCQCWLSEKLCFCLSKSKRCGHFEHPHAFTQFTEVLPEFDFRRTSKTGETGENNKWKYLMRRSFCECVWFFVCRERIRVTLICPCFAAEDERAQARDGDDCPTANALVSLLGRWHHAPSS